jgi:hypothetical protein
VEKDLWRAVGSRGAALQGILRTGVSSPGELVKNGYLDGLKTYDQEISKPAFSQKNASPTTRSAKSRTSSTFPPTPDLCTDLHRTASFEVLFNSNLWDFLPVFDVDVIFRWPRFH